MLKEELLNFIDLASEHKGGEVVFATSDIYASKESLIKPWSEKASNTTAKPSGWVASKNTSFKHHWVVVKLGIDGIIKGFNIDTRPFKKNFPSAIAIDAIRFNGRVEDWELANFLEWDQVLSRRVINANEQHFFEIDSNKPYTHIRLHVHAHIGVARFRVFCTPYKDWNKVSEEETLDLASILYGAKIIFIEHPSSSSITNLISPKKSEHHTDGWITDATDTNSLILKLAHKGIIEKIIIDTYNFKGNHIKNCAIDYCISNNDDDVINNQVDWKELLPKKGLKSHRENPFIINNFPDENVVTHIKLKVFSKGGISRLRLIGSIKK